MTKPILFLCNTTSDLDYNSGVQRVTRQLAKAIQELNIPIIPVNFSKGGFEYLNEKQLSNLERWNGPKVSKWTKRDNFKNDLKEAKYFINPETIDIYKTYRTYELFWHCRSNGIKSSVIFYDAIPLTMAYMYPGLQHPMQEHVEGINSADHVFAISEESKNSFIIHSANEDEPFFHNAKISTISLPTEIDLKKPNDYKVYNPKDVQMTFVSSFNPRKNHRLLIIAFAKAYRILALRGINLTLNLVGSGDLDNQHMDLVKNPPPGININIYQNCSDEDLIEVYRKSDFTIYPSLYEGFGLPIVESLFFNVPVLTSDRGSLAEVAAGGGCVTFPIPIGREQDPDILVDKIVEFASQPELLQLLRDQIPNRDSKTWKEYALQILSELEY